MNNRRRIFQVLLPIASLIVIVPCAIAGIVITLMVFGTSADGIPREGYVAIQEDLGQWNESDTPLLRSTTDGHELLLSIEEGAWTRPELEDLDPEAPWGGNYLTQREDYDDFSAAVDIRNVNANTYARGCLTVRAQEGAAPDEAYKNSSDDFSKGDHSLNICISEHYGIYGWWRDLTNGDDEDAAGRYIWFDENARSALKPLSEWNRLKIIAKGRTIWIFLNGEYIGAAMHDGPQNGAIGVSIEIPNNTTGTFAFRDLEIHQLGWI